MFLDIVSEYTAVHDSQFYDKNTAIISITQPNSDDVVFAENPFIKCIFRMKFYDLDIGEGKVSNLPEVTEKDFKGLKEFVDNLESEKIEQLIVHCAAGISRSAGVGAAINEYLHLGKKIWDNRIYFPNMLVYKLACKELGILKTQEDYDKLFGIRKDSSMFSGSDLIPLYEKDKIKNNLTFLNKRIGDLCSYMDIIYDIVYRNAKDDTRDAYSEAKKILTLFEIDETAKVERVLFETFNLMYIMFSIGQVRFKLKIGFLDEDYEFFKYQLFLITESKEITVTEFVSMESEVE